jgi:hypothetical protein
MAEACARGFLVRPASGRLIPLGIDAVRAMLKRNQTGPTPAAMSAIYDRHA